tara:strand:+ start:43400 stop:44803 length:1404 start_codon:yes stop_codon:yes gene_type:complete
MSTQNKSNWLAPLAMIMLGGLFYCYEYILRISPSIMIPELMESFSIKATQIGVLSSFYYWGYAMGSVMVGPFIDKYGAKRVLFWAAIACAVGIFCFAYTESFLMAKICRVAIGLGSAFAFIGVLKIGAMWLPARYFGRLAGMSSMLGAASGMLGQIFLSSLMKDYTWQTISIYSGLVGGVIGLLILIFLKDKPGIQTPIEQSCEVETFGQLVHNFKKVAIRSVFWKNCMIGFTTFLPLIVFADLWGVPFLQKSYHLSREEAAVCVSMVFLGWALGGPSFGYLFDTFKKWGVTFFWGTAIAMVSSMFILFAPMEIGVLKLVLFVFGFSGSSHVLVFVSSKRMSPKGIEGTTLGVTNLFMMSAGVLIQPCIGIAIDKFSVYLLQQHDIHLSMVYAYQYALSIVPISLGLTLILIVQVTKQTEVESPSPNFKSNLPQRPHLSMLTYESWSGNRYSNRVEESPGSAGQSAR